MKYLTDNYKLLKCIAMGYLAKGLQMAPHTIGSPRAEFGLDTVCLSSTAECRAACIYASGRGRMDVVKKGRIKRKRDYILYPHILHRKLSDEIEALVRRAKRKELKPAVRLNVFSDIDWASEFPELFVRFGNVQFYDYSKRPDIAFRPRLPNYYIAFSWSGSNLEECRIALSKGISVAFPYDGTTTAIWKIREMMGFQKKTVLGNAIYYPTVDGDEHDLIFLHPPGSIILLREKTTPGSKASHNFIVRGDS